MATELYALFGNPIDRSPSPAMQNAAFAALGIDARYELRPAEHGEAERVIAQTRRELRGANVTIPLKTEVAARVRCVGAADRAGAVNTLWWRDGELVGSLTDVEGVKEPLTQLGFAGGGSALILGAGGAARAAALALAELGCTVQVAARRVEAAGETLSVVDDPGRACDLADVDQVGELFAGAAVIVQATPLGRGGESHALPWERAAPELIAFEMLAVPRRTPFLSAAAAQGLRAVEGWQMLVAQGAASFCLWTGREAPRDVMAAAAAASSP